MAANPLTNDVSTNVEGTPEERYHVYHAEAKIFDGHLNHPIAQPVDFEGHVILSKTRREGHISRATQANTLEGLISFKSGHTRASGNKVEKTDVWGNKHAGWVTLSTSVIEGLNVLEVITADRVVAQVSTEHPVKKGHVPKVTFLGTRFENLRVGGYPVDVELDLGICGDKPEDDLPYIEDDGFLDRVEQQMKSVVDGKGVPKVLEDAYEKKIAYIDELKGRKKGSAGCSKVVCSVVKSIGPIPIPGVMTFGNVIVIPEFGTVSLGELEVGIESVTHNFPNKQNIAAVPDTSDDSNYFTLHMLNMHLGCIAGGSVKAGSATTNGITRP
jgi:hypothetical protein